MTVIGGGRILNYRYRAVHCIHYTLQICSVFNLKLCCIKAKVISEFPKSFNIIVKENTATKTQHDASTYEYIEHSNSVQFSALLKLLSLPNVYCRIFCRIILAKLFHESLILWDWLDQAVDVGRLREDLRNDLLWGPPGVRVLPECFTI